MREPEPETIGRARSGDPVAFESLVRAYQGDAWRFAYHLTRNRAAAEDVTQEAFLRAYKGLRSYRGQSKFTSWLFRIVRNCAVDAYRKTRREIAVAEPGGAEAAGPWAGPAPSGPAEDRIRLEQAMRRLPPILREPFVVIEVLGFTYQEAAVILDTRIGTIKSRMHRARAHLMEWLIDPEVADEV